MTYKIKTGKEEFWQQDSQEIMLQGKQLLIFRANTSDSEFLKTEIVIQIDTFSPFSLHR